MAPVTVITRYVPLVVGWLAAWWMLWRLPVPRPLDPGTDATASLADVAVVIPARDEAEHLPTLLASLDGARAVGVEVVVVDDHSTDDTAAVAETAGARVIAAPELPAGWAGKPHACAVGAAATTRLRARGRRSCSSMRTRRSNRTDSRASSPSSGRGVGCCRCSPST
jgi:cellulose synthase/poly-beta-1,6-N-acetylglucosamine synthase-like glycosyltransferase